MIGRGNVAGRPEIELDVLAGEMECKKMTFLSYFHPHSRCDFEIPDKTRRNCLSSQFDTNPTQVESDKALFDVAMTQNGRIAHCGT
jgi:hypothetical protein